MQQCTEEYSYTEFRYLLGLLVRMSHKSA
jgi:hypothetical protein